ncbi:MAG TPA: hypothetical protein VNA25_25465 [Phycisphaerae bacterium]|nr:hypothetical protein [Phycisphaerae bacterium]
MSVELVAGVTRLLLLAGGGFAAWTLRTALRAGRVFDEPGLRPPVLVVVELPLEPIHRPQHGEVHLPAEAAVRFYPPHRRVGINTRLGGGHVQLRTYQQSAEHPLADRNGLEPRPSRGMPTETLR